MSIRLAALPLLLLAACATRTPAPQVAQVVQVVQVAQVVQSWESPAAEFPAICMSMRADGGLAFQGGFEFYNPGTWRQDGGRLTITLGGGQPFPADISKEQLRGHAGALAAYDAALRQLSYNVPPATGSIGLGGFHFHRRAGCGVQ